MKISLINPEYLQLLQQLCQKKINNYWKLYCGFPLPLPWRVNNEEVFFSIEKCIESLQAEHFQKTILPLCATLNCGRDYEKKSKSWYIYRVALCQSDCLNLSRDILKVKSIFVWRKKSKMLWARFEPTISWWDRV